MFSAGSTEAYLACLDDSSIKYLRSSAIYGTSWRPKNEPIERLQDIRFGSLQPANTTEDPYIVATLIAMAQWQRQHNQESASEDSPSSQIQSAASRQKEASTVAPESFEVLHNPLLYIV